MTWAEPDDVKDHCPADEHRGVGFLGLHGQRLRGHATDAQLQCESNRVSRTNSPCGCPCRMAPPRSLMQRVEPSITVTRSWAGP